MPEIPFLYPSGHSGSELRKSNLEVLEDIPSLGSNDKGRHYFRSSKPRWWNGYYEITWPEFTEMPFRYWVDAGRLGFTYPTWSDRYDLAVDVNLSDRTANQTWQLYQSALSSFQSNSRVLGTLSTIDSSWGEYQWSNLHGMTVRIECELECSMLLNFNAVNTASKRRIVARNFSAQYPGTYTQPIRAAIFKYDDNIQQYNYAYPSGAWVLIGVEPLSPWARPVYGYTPVPLVDNPAIGAIEAVITLPEEATANLPYEGFYLVDLSVDLNETGRRTGSPENLNNVWASQTLEIRSPYDPYGTSAEWEVVDKSPLLTGTTPTNGLVFRNVHLRGSRIIGVSEPPPSSHKIQFRVRGYSGNAGTVTKAVAYIRYLGASYSDYVIT